MTQLAMKPTLDNSVDSVHNEDMSESVKFLGCNDEQTVCDLCGRDDLKKTVVLDIDGDVVRYGSDCAARALKWGVKDVRSAAKKAQDELDAQALAEATAARRSESARWFAWLDSKSTAPSVTEQIHELGGYGAAKRAYREAVAA